MLAGSESFLAGVGQNIWVFLLVASVLFVFHLFRPNGFAAHFLDYQLKRRQLDSKRLDDTRRIADILQRKHDPEEPMLPFDDPSKEP
jgi:hypothetical protein